MLRRSLALLICVGLSLLARAGETDPLQDIRSGGPSWTDRVIILPIEGAIGITPFDPIVKQVDAAFDRIENEKPSLVVLRIDSPGGEVEACGQISERILKSPVPTVALITKNAISGGAMVAISADEIVMVRGSRIGDVQPMLMTGQPIDERTAEKFESYIRGIMSSHGEESDYPAPLLEAMVSRSIELYRVTMDDGEKTFLTAKELEVLEDKIDRGIESRAIVNKELIIEEGKLLVLTPKQAVEYGLAKAVVDSPEAFYSDRNIDEGEAIVVDIAQGGSIDLPSIGISPWKLVVLGILLTIGITGLLTEMHAPGFGIPGAAGIIGFAGFFLVLVLANHAEWYEILLFFIGVALLVVEVAVLPGFGVPGVSGILCILAGLFLAFMPDFDAVESNQVLWTQAAHFVMMMLATFASVLVLGYLLVSYGDRLPVIRDFYVRTSIGGGLGGGGREAVEAQAEERHREERQRSALIGTQGIALTALRPSGKVRLDDGATLDVITEGSLIDSGQRVQVVATRMNYVIVAEAPAGTTGEAEA